MIQLSEIKPGIRLNGILSRETVEVIAATPVAEDAVDLVYRTSDGGLRQQMLYAGELEKISVETRSLHWQFDADTETVRLASEAYRIRLAHLFDPHLAVHTSLIQPLPHQITAVYGDLLPRQPLRFLLADDPGAGKTIMTGLLIKELRVRGDLNRCLIICPGNLVEQWQDELYSRFQLEFDILTNDRIDSSVRGNAFIDTPLCIARLDKLARNEEIQEKLKVSDWDLIVCDEAHKMSATYNGNEERRTKRYNLGMLLSGITRHFLLLTATPHNGKDDDFQLFMRLLDSDRFVGRNRGNTGIDAMDIMRRLVKEQLLTFDGKPLFPERIAHTLDFELSPHERLLYDEVTEYVQNGFNRAMEVLDPSHAHAVGFALTILQRRLASSPEAIYQSLHRRRERLEKTLDGIDRHGLLTPSVRDYADRDWSTIEEDLEEAPEEEINAIEEEFVDEATAARSRAELVIEIEWLKELEARAHALRNSGVDHKWEQVSKTLQDNNLMYGSNGSREKIIIFTEHRDTLNYLADKIANMLGRPEAVVTIRGGMRREERKLIEESFKNDPNVSVLVATDAAGEGINLQRAHLMINYDLPWNPNRIEQRFGRVHRIGQREICHLWNLVAMETREGDVFHRLFEKLNREREALGGRVFDVLGKVTFGDRSLRDLLKEAIFYGNKPEVRARLDQVIDEALDHRELERLLEERSLAGQSLGLQQVNEIRESMELIEARRLQPHYIAGFFSGAYQKMKGQIRKKGDNRFSLPHVPARLRERRSPTGVPWPIAREYELITFDKNSINITGKPDATLVCPGHPLLSALIDEVLERGQEALKRGTVFIDDTEGCLRDRLLFYIEDVIEDGRKDSAGRPIKISHKLHFVEMNKEGHVTTAGYAPYLDYTTPSETEYSILQQMLADKAWWGQDAERLARDHAVRNLLPAHLTEVKDRRLRYVNKVEGEVVQRLSSEIAWWDAEAGKQYDKAAQGKTNARLNADRFKERVYDLERRLRLRLEELAQERNIVSKPPTVLGGAWVVPRAMLNEAISRFGKPSGGNSSAETPDTSGTPEGRALIERIAMETIMAIESELGHFPEDVANRKVGYDIVSRISDDTMRFIEVKGRQAGIGMVTVTHNEMVTAANKPDDTYLAVVEVDGNKRSVTYFLRWNTQAPGLADVSHTVQMDKLRLIADVVLEQEIEV
ncbi:MAG: SNF2-related protein [Peptococcaceae bacterium]|nr:SNF2-related protein [Peptococcaceae bacterium]